MEATAAPKSAKSGLLRRGNAWAKALDVAYALLWFEYLKISPSYELARRHRMGSWTAADEARKPVDFDTVLAVYDDLGDVRSLLFREWWLATAIDHFGFKGATPRVMRLGTARHGADGQAEKLTANSQAYLDKHWIAQGEPTAMMLAIPVELSKAQILKQVSALLEKYAEAHSGSAARPPKYRLISRKLDKNSLFKYLKCVWIKAELPKTALWRIGAHAKVSSTYSGRLDPKAKLSPHHLAEDRNALKIVTSRAISRGILIAENAARGQFPTYAKNDCATPPDWNDIRVAVKRRIELDRHR